MQIAISIFLLLVGLFLLIFPQVVRQNHINSYISGLKKFRLNASSTDVEKTFTGTWFYRIAGLLIFASGVYLVYGIILKDF